MKIQRRLLNATTAACLLCTSGVQAGVVTQFFNFDNNQLPSAWGSLGPVVRNQRVEFSEVGDAFGNNNTFMPIALGNAKRVTIEYDANASGNLQLGAQIWGGSASTYTRGGVSVYSTADAASFGTTGIFAVNVNSNTMSNGMYNTYMTGGSGPIHVSAAFHDGLVSLSFTDRTTGTTTSVRDTESPFLSFRDNMLFGLFGGIGSGASGWIDNVKITTETRAPRTFGLYVGVDQTQPNSLGVLTTLPGAKEARDLYNSSNAQHYKSEVLTANLDVGEGITKAQILEKLKLLVFSGMGAGDTLVLSITGHGSSEVPLFTGKGTDLITLGDRDLFGRRGFTDQDLYDLLVEIDPDGIIKKEIFLMACNAGGFWAADDVFESGHKNLRDLKNVSLFAASQEYGVTYFDPLIGTYYGEALEHGISSGKLNELTPFEFSQYLIDEAYGIAHHINAPVFYEAGFGDAVAADPSLFKFFVATTDDFNLDEPLARSSVPEPSSFTLAFFAMSLMALTLRRRNAKLIQRPRCCTDPYSSACEPQ